MVAFNILPLLLLILIIVVTIIVLVSKFWRRKKLKGVELPCCGSCHYCVRGLETNTCPECGSNLNEVGVLTDARLHARFTIHPTIIWSIVYAIGFLFFSTFVVSMLPLQCVWYGDRVVVLDRPVSGQYGLIKMKQRFKQIAGTTVDQPIILDIPVSDKRTVEKATLSVSLSADSATLFRGDEIVAENLRISASTITLWLETNGADVGTNGIKNEVSVVLRELDDTYWTQFLRPAGGGFSSSSGGLTTSRGAFTTGNSSSSMDSVVEMVWYHKALLLLAGLIWLAGIFLIMRKRSGLIEKV